MRNDLVVRRFEVHAGGADALADAQSALREAVDKVPGGDVKARIDESPEALAITVRLEGAAAAVATVRDSLLQVRGVIVYRDFFDVPPPAPPEAPVGRTPAPSGGDDDYVYPDQRVLLRIDPEERSRREAGSGASVVVAIVDSGVMVDHPDLHDHLWTRQVRGQKVYGACFVSQAAEHDPTDQDGHGTMLAGSMLATANRVPGLELMAVKFFDVMTQPSAASAARAIRFAVDNGASIIDLSFDLGLGSLELEHAIQSAFDAGALVVMAAGNTGSDNDRYPLVPARYAAMNPDSAIVVMATDWYDERPTFSNFGDTTVDLAAPGVNVVSTRSFLSTDGPPRKYGRYTGTSGAAAQVAGAAALLKSQEPRRTARDLKRCLMASVDELPRLRCAIHGRLNLSRALALGPPTGGPD